MSGDYVPLPESEWVGPSMVLIERDADVLVPVRTLTSLVSFALAGPSSEVSTRIRDRAVDEAHRAISAAYFGRKDQAMSGEFVLVPQRWVDEVVLALDAATTIGKRSCREGDHLHYANHDRLLREAGERGYTPSYVGEKYGGPSPADILRRTADSSRNDIHACGDAGDDNPRITGRLGGQG